MVLIWLAASGFGGGEGRGGGELPCHSEKITPAGRSRGASDPAHVPEYRLTLFAIAASNPRFEGLNGTRIP